MSDWLGKKIRKGKDIGKIVNDLNGRYRILTVQFDNRKEDIVLNNIGMDPESCHDFEWEVEIDGEKKWYRF